MKTPRLRRLRLLKRKPQALSDVEKKRGMHIYILPNLLTTGNMFFGFYSIIFSIQENILYAAYAVIGAAVFDALDGRVARLTHATSKFGVEYDSLSDLISFGVAPALLLYQWALKPFDRVGWLVCFLFMACGALRLARFNVQVANVEKKYFQGLPIPMAAGIVATSVPAFMEMGIDPVRNRLILAMTTLLAFVMVSNFRYRSFKDLDFRERKPFGTLIVGLCVLVFIAYRPEVNLFIAFITYAVLGAVMGILSPARRKISQVIVAERGHREGTSTHDTNPKPPAH